MIGLLQRVSQAKVEVDGASVGSTVQILHMLRPMSRPWGPGEPRLEHTLNAR